MPEYPGSYRLSDAQIAKLTSSNAEDQATVLLDQAKDVARLIGHLIKTENLPSPVENNNRRSGGVSILAWSIGNAYLLSLLANTDKLDKELNTLLERFVSSVLFYGE